MNIETKQAIDKWVETHMRELKTDDDGGVLSCRHNCDIFADVMLETGTMIVPDCWNCKDKGCGGVFRSPQEWVQFRRHANPLPGVEAEKHTGCIICKAIREGGIEIDPEEGYSVCLKHYLLNYIPIKLRLWGGFGSIIKFRGKK